MRRSAWLRWIVAVVIVGGVVVGGLVPPGVQATDTYSQIVGGGSNSGSGVTKLLSFTVPNAAGGVYVSGLSVGWGSDGSWMDVNGNAVVYDVLSGGSTLYNNRYPVFAGDVVNVWTYHGNGAATTWTGAGVINAGSVTPTPSAGQIVECGRVNAGDSGGKGNCTFTASVAATGVFYRDLGDQFGLTYATITKNSVGVWNYPNMPSGGNTGVATFSIAPGDVINFQWWGQSTYHDSTATGIGLSGVVATPTPSPTPTFTPSPTSTPGPWDYDYQKGLGVGGCQSVQATTVEWCRLGSFVAPYSGYREYVKGWATSGYLKFVLSGVQAGPDLCGNGFGEVACGPVGDSTAIVGGGPVLFGQGVDVWGKSDCLPFLDPAVMAYNATHPGNPLCVNNGYLQFHEAGVVLDDRLPTATPMPTSTPEATTSPEPTWTPYPTFTPEATSTAWCDPGVYVCTTPTPQPTWTPMDTPTPYDIPATIAAMYQTPTPMPTDTPYATGTPMPTATPIARGSGGCSWYDVGCGVSWGVGQALTSLLVPKGDYQGEFRELMNEGGGRLPFGALGVVSAGLSGLFYSMPSNPQPFTFTLDLSANGTNPLRGWTWVIVLDFPGSVFFRWLTGLAAWVTLVEFFILVMRSFGDNG